MPGKVTVKKPAKRTRHDGTYWARDPFAPLFVKAKCPKCGKKTPFEVSREAGVAVFFKRKCNVCSTSWRIRVKPDGTVTFQEDENE